MKTQLETVDVRRNPKEFLERFDRYNFKPSKIVYSEITTKTRKTSAQRKKNMPNHTQNMYTRKTANENQNKTGNQRTILIWLYLNVQSSPVNMVMVAWEEIIHVYIYQREQKREREGKSFTTKTNINSNSRGAKKE